MAIKQQTTAEKLMEMSTLADHLASIIVARDYRPEQWSLYRERIWSGIVKFYTTK